MGHRVAVPSYQRAELFPEMTLKTLRDAGVSQYEIDLFVATDAERDLYWHALGNSVATITVVGEPGLWRARRAIDRFYDKGEPYVCFDDDVRGVFHFVDPKTIIPVTDLPALFDQAFRFMHQGQATLWGVYPVLNPFFMDGSITFDLRFCGGWLWGATTHHDETLDVRGLAKEDYERTLLRYCRDGSVCRLNYIAAKTAYRMPRGGLSTLRTPTMNEQAARDLTLKFPSLVTLWQRKNGWYELKLKDRRIRT